MKVLVTGGAGFIGSYTVDKLIEQGYQVIVVDNLYNGNKNAVNEKAKFYHTDITWCCLDSIFEKEKPEYVIHLAAQIDVQKSFQYPVLDAYVNILGTINLLQCCIKQQVKKIVYSSSAAVYGIPEYLGIDEKHKLIPISNYGVSKCTSEKYIQVYHQVYGLKYTILRYSNVYGFKKFFFDTSGVISIFIDRILNSKEVIVFGNGEQSRDFIYIDDIVNANIISLVKGDNQVLNIGTGTKSTINQLVETLSEITNHNIQPKYCKNLRGDILDSYFDISKARRILGWKPQNCLREGLYKTYMYYKENLKELMRF